MPRDDEAPRTVWPPEPGYFRMKLVKNGWPAPCEIQRREVDGLVLWQAIVDGDVMPEVPRPERCPHIERIWTSGFRIDETEYRWRNSLRDSARKHRVQHPAANARRPIIVMRLRPIE